jgi:starvation-inducible DNA-binding protein
LGHYAPGTLKQMLQLSSLSEQNRSANDSAGFITELLHDHQSLIMELRGLINRFANEYQDLGTSDFVTGLMEEHEKMAWFLRAHLR